jgi:hypothetical protein
MSEQDYTLGGRRLLEGADSSLSASSILLTAALVAVGSGIYQGTFSYQGLALLLAALGLAVRLHFRPLRGLPAPETLLIGMLLAFLALGCTLSSGQRELMVPLDLPKLNQHLRQLNGWGIAVKLIELGALLLSLTFLLPSGSRGRFPARRFILLVAFAAAQHVLILQSAPRPPVDVFVSQTEGAQGLFEGRNVYSMEFTPLYPGEKADHYGYPPASFYPVAVAWRLFGDVRFAWVICQLLAAYFLYRLARRAQPDRPRFARLLTLTFLFLPRGLFVIEQSWTEPLVLATLGGFALAWYAGARPAVAGLALGLWLSSKQYVVVALPLLFKLIRRRLTIWLTAALTGIALLLPFALWDYRALLHDVLLFFLKSQGRGDALSVYAGLLRHGIELPWAVVTPLWLAGIAFFTWRMRRGLAGLLFSTASLWLYFFLLGKQAFTNYFHLVIFAFLLAAATAPMREEETP